MADVGDIGRGPEFSFEVVDGPEPGRTIPLREGDLVVGRGEHCSIRLSAEGVAPAHCGVRVRADRVVLAPGGTVVPTLVNGQRLSAARLLRVGDRVSVGPYTLVLRVSIRDEERRFTAGDTVGPYRIVAELGSGGVGRVYEAQDRYGRVVALKTLRIRSDWSRRQLEHRKALLRREAAALAAIDHPHVVRSYGSGEHDGVPWLAMELLDGVTLREKLSAGRLPVRQIESIMFQLCSAVAAVHRAGVVHRDLKPANVMLVGPDERVCLADFGLAQPRGAPRLEELDPADYTEAIRVGRQVGTPLYMPPEQTRGEEADLRSDVWSLGAMLYELASGRRPFGGRDVRAVLTSVVEDCPRELPDDVAPHLRSAVYRCLQKRRDRRFRDAVELLEVIGDRRVVQLLPVGAEGPPRLPLRGCPLCGAPIENPVHCVKCHGRIFRYTDGQVLTVPGPDGIELCCGTCATVVFASTERCPTCLTTYTDLPPEGLSRTAVRLTTGGTTVVDIFDRALELLEHCPYCHTPRPSGALACAACGFNHRAFVCGRVELELAVGGWTMTCTNCGCSIPQPDEANCPSCGLNFANGMFPNGTRYHDQVPDFLRRRLE